MEAEAFNRARQGDVAFFGSQPEATLRRWCVLKDDDDRSLLHVAAGSGNARLCQLLLENGAATVVNNADDEGWTPLHTACSSGHAPIAELLLAASADANASTSGGQTPLHYAASKGHEAVARLLLARGGDVTKKDKTGGTPLHRACGAGRLALARLLIEEARAGIEVADRSGATPLLVAVSSGQDAVAVYLASKGANLEAMSKEEETPLGMALAPLRAALLQARAGEADEGDMEVQ